VAEILGKKTAQSHEVHEILLETMIRFYLVEWKIGNVSAFSAWTSQVSMVFAGAAPSVVLDPQMALGAALWRIGWGLAALDGLLVNCLLDFFDSEGAQHC